MSEILTFHFAFLTVAASDRRLRLMHEVLRSEKVYQDCLRSIFDIYAEPLR